MNRTNRDITTLPICKETNFSKLTSIQKASNSSDVSPERYYTSLICETRVNKLYTEPTPHIIQAHQHPEGKIATALMVLMDGTSSESLEGKRTSSLMALMDGAPSPMLCKTYQ